METAKEAFAKAIEWRVVEKFEDISMTDDVTTYAIAEFTSAMAFEDIATTIDEK